MHSPLQFRVCLSGCGLTMAVEVAQGPGWLKLGYPDNVERVTRDEWSSSHLPLKTASFFSPIIIIMYIYHALINTLSTHLIHICLNTIFYTHLEHSPTKTIYVRYYNYGNTCTHAHTHTHNDCSKMASC